MDPAVDELLLDVGYSLASHIMARSSLSRGTGRYEEVLTADIADQVALFDPYQDFLSNRGSKSRVRLFVKDFPKNVEKAIGADFAIVARGRSLPDGTDIRKLVLVQAKRQDWASLKYAASTNHVAKANSMIQTVGMANAFFAFYHCNSVLQSVIAPWAGAPNFLYASPAAHGNTHFFPKNCLYHSAPEGFLELSMYRRHLLGAQKSISLPPGYEWGVGMLPASYFVNSLGVTVNSSLPTIAHVLTHGSWLGKFLVDLANCPAGTNLRSDADLLALLRALEHGTTGEGPGTFAPQFALIVQFLSAMRDTEVGPAENDDGFWLSVEDIR